MFWRCSPRPPSGGAKSGEVGPSHAPSALHNPPNRVCIKQIKGGPRLCVHVQRHCRRRRPTALIAAQWKHLSHGREGKENAHDCKLQCTRAATDDRGPNDGDK
jgi:hypothetical protein